MKKSTRTSKSTKIKKSAKVNKSTEANKSAEMDTSAEMDESNKTNESTDFKKLIYFLLIFVAVVMSLVFLVCLILIIDVSLSGLSYEIDIYGQGAGFMVLALAIGGILVIIAMLMLKVVLGSSICHKCVISKKFVSTDDTIIDGTNGEKIRFKDRDRTEPIEIEIQENVLSTSKTIALIGSIAILLLFMGFGAATIAKYLYIGIVPYGQMSKIFHFLLGGSVLFVPYIINKMFNAGRNLTKRK